MFAIARYRRTVSASLKIESRAMDARKRTLADAGALASDLLVEACGTDLENALQLEVVRDLALDLGRRLEVLAREDAAGSLIEAALACADLAILAACNLSVLPDKPPATAAVHLAAGATLALIPLIEQETEQETATLDEANTEYTLKDA